MPERWLHRTWFPSRSRAREVVLRRHVPENLAAFRRWYADPEIARLARYQETPMRAEEIERFFTARVVGPEALAMAVHLRATDRLIGTCAFSQLDADNGSALYHITIGESDAWGQGYGTEATQLMLDHAFGRSACTGSRCSCSSSTSAPIRAYKRCGFVDRGPRARVDLARRALVGRAGDEHARVGLAERRPRREADAEGRPTTPATRTPTSRPCRCRRAPRVRRARPTGCAGSSSGCDDHRDRRAPTPPGPRSAS